MFANRPVWQWIAGFALLKLLVGAVVAWASANLMGAAVFDIPDYKLYTQCNLHGPNGLFAWTLCLIGIERAGDPQAIFISFVLYLFRDLLLLAAARKFIGNRALVLLALMLALHPYLALYSLRYTTSLFACLAIVLIFIQIGDKRVSGIWVQTALVLMSGMRQGLAAVVIPFQLAELWRARSLGWRSIAAGSAGLAGVAFIVMLPGLSYADSFLAASPRRYPLGYPNVLEWFDTGLAAIDYLLAACTVFFSHLVLLLGFREAAFTQFPDALLPLNFKNISQIAISLALCVLHGIGLWLFFRRFARRDWRYLLLLLYVFPWFLAVAHMRYLLPLIPFALLGIAMWIDQNWPERETA